ncbi:MAG: hypothetical protein O7157_02565 [Wolbachia endosymbiont of Tetragnatha montana]|nr:hypothetical protein [Wolbachia endosymbiont of Tetragnatha montana]
MGQCTTNQTRELIPHLKKVNSKLQGESIKLFSDKESIIVERRKPVVEEMLKYLESSSITNCNTMIDAETGFGKTYDIGLWSHALDQLIPKQNGLTLAGFGCWKWLYYLNS